MSWGVGRYARRAARREPFPDRPADTPEEQSGKLTNRRA